MNTAIITFDTTTDAMAMEDFSKHSDVSGRLIPIPNQISAGCGLAWDYKSDDKDGAISILKENNIKYTEVVVIDI